MIPTARLCHAISGRMRIRIPDKRRDAAYFLETQRRLTTLDGIDTVDANPVTASLLLHHRSSEQAIVEFARREGLFRLEEPDNAADAESISERAYASLRALDQQVRDLSRGGMDFW